MARRLALTRGLLVLMTCASLAACDDQPPLEPNHCEIETLGKLPLGRLHNIPVVEAKIDGKPVLFLVDTGAFNSVLFAKNAKSLDLAYTGGMVHASGAHGREEEPVVRIDKLDLGSGTTSDHLFTLTETMAPRSPPSQPPIVGLLGAEFLLAADLVIDMPHHAMYLLNMRRCPYVTPYWKGTIHKIQVDRDEGINKIGLHFTINGGKPIPAIFDTGASGIIIPYGLAHKKTGVTRTDLKKDRSGTGMQAIGDDVVTSYYHEFDHLDLGDFRINNARVIIDDADNLDYALFGARFLQHTRIWLTTKDVMYVQHVSEMQDAPPIPMSK